MALLAERPLQVGAGEVAVVVAFLQLHAADKTESGLALAVRELAPAADQLGHRLALGAALDLGRLQISLHGFVDIRIFVLPFGVFFAGDVLVVLALMRLLSTLSAKVLAAFLALYPLPHVFLVFILRDVCKPLVAVGAGAVVGVVLTKLLQHETVVFLVHVVAHVGFHLLVGDWRPTAYRGTHQIGCSHTSLADFAIEVVRKAITAMAMVAGQRHHVFNLAVVVKTDLALVPPVLEGLFTQGAVLVLFLPDLHEQLLGGLVHVVAVFEGLAGRR